MAAGQNLLAAALAAGIPLPHSCREGRCASCKARLLAGQIAYPLGALPPGITASEAARGEVLLCQARLRSDAVVEVRLLGSLPAPVAVGEIGAIEPLPLHALCVRLRNIDGTLTARPGQFVEVINDAGLRARLPVIAARGDEIDLEAANDGSAFRDWLAKDAATGSRLDLSGPFDAPR